MFRRTAAPAKPTVRESLACFFIACVLEIIIGARNLEKLLDGDFVNPDSTMRLARLADTLRLGAPVDAVLRDQSGTPFVLHWSHLLDMLLLALAAPLRLAFPGNRPEAADAPLPAAVHWAAVLSGPLAVALLTVAVLWAVAPFADRPWRWCVVPALVLAEPVSNYGLPGEVHHHVLLAVVATMVAGWAARAPVAGGWAGWKVGLWAGVGIWLSPETMPLSLLAIGGVWLQWLVRLGAPAPRRALLMAGPGFLLVLLLALAIDPGSGGEWRRAIDHISVLYVALAVAVCAIGVAAWALDRTTLRPSLRAACGAAAAGLAFACWIAAFPIVLHGTDALVTSARARAIHNTIVEMAPVTNLADGFRFLTGGLFAVAVLGALAAHRRLPMLGYATLCAVVLLGFAALHRRFAIYDATLAAATLAIALSLISRASWGAGLGGMAARLGCMVGLLAVPFVPGAFPSSGSQSSATARICSTRHVAALLAPYVGQVVLGDINDSPDLLYRTGVLTVGSLYHRAPDGFVRLADAWRSPGDTAEIPAAVRATGAALVLACPGQGRMGMDKGLDEDTLFDRLNRNVPPPWLERVGTDAAGHVLYRVLRTG